MRRAAAILSVAAAVLWTATVFAQGKPNFAGKWTLDQEKTAAANPNAGGGGGGGGRAGGGGGRQGGGGAFELRQDANTLSRVTTTQDGTENVTAYKLDGSEATMPMGRGGEAKVKARWEGNTIVIETTSDRGNGPSTSKAVYSMEGEWLVIATTNPGRGGGEPTTTKRYYKKG